MTGIFLPLPSVWNRKTCSDTQLLKVLMTVKDFCWRTISVSAEFRFLTLCNISGMELQQDKRCFIHHSLEGELMSAQEAWHSMIKGSEAAENMKMEADSQKKRKEKKIVGLKIWSTGFELFAQYVLQVDQRIYGTYCSCLVITAYIGP